MERYIMILSRHTLVFFVLLIFILMFTSLDTYAEESSRWTNIRFEQISGLSESKVYCIFQDRKGFLWLGTENGLVMYDGYKFTIFKQIPFDKTSLLGKPVYAITEDSRGNLWVGTRGGLNRFDNRTDTFHHYVHDPDNPNSLSINDISVIFEDKKQNIWIGTIGGGLNKLDPASGIFTRYQYDPSDTLTISGNYVNAICEEGDGTLWLAISGSKRHCGLERFDTVKETFTHFRYDPNDSTGINDSAIRSLAMGKSRYLSGFPRCLSLESSGKLWIGTIDMGVDCYDTEKGTFTHYQHDPSDRGSLGSNVIKSVYVDNSGVVWVGTIGGGLNRFEPESGTFIRYEHDPLDPGSIGSNNIWSICEDRSGNLFIGTEERGIYRLENTSGKFTHYFHRHGDPNSLNFDNVRAVCEDSDGNIWLGTVGGGLTMINRETGQYTHYVTDPNNPLSIQSNTVLSILEDSSGFLWIGTWPVGVDRFDRKKKTFTHYNFHTRDEISRLYNREKTIYEDHEGIIWIGWPNGLERFDPETEKFKHYTYTPDDEKSLSNKRVLSIFEDSKGILWVGTANGLNRFNRENETFTRYYYSYDNTGGLSDNHIMCMQEDNSGFLWIGTGGGGLNRFDRATESFTHFMEYDGLINNVVKAILNDNKGNLWLSTDGGISKFNTQTETFTSYTIEDGLLSNEFNREAAYKARSGRYYFGSVNGLVSFVPRDLVVNTTVPPVVITSFKKFNNVVKLGRDITDIGDIHLSHNEHSIAFEFAALDFTAPGKNQYAYILEGFDDDWIYAGTQRFANYTNLEPGDYVFRIKGSNNDGVWNEDGASVRIIIIPPFWGTWWFRIVAFITLLGIVISVPMVRINKVNRQKRILEGLVAERTQRITQLNSLIQAVRNVNQLIAKEKDRDRLLKGTCESFSEIHGFNHAWIALINESGKLVSTSETGLGKKFLPLVKLLKRGELPVCAKRALAQPEVVIIKDDSTCNDCPLVGSKDDSGTMSIRLEHDKKVYGILTITLQIDAFNNEDEQNLLHEVAGDIAFGLYSMELEEKRKQAEKMLKKAYEEMEEKVAERTKKLTQANIQLKELDQLKSMFIASMSHELRTPLNSIIGFTGILMMGVAGEITEEQSKQLTMVKNSANHLLALINDIIDVSKIEADKVELLIEEFDLSTIVQEVKDSFIVAVDNKGLKMPLKMPGKLVIKSDERRVKQIIVNLAGNAVKFTDEGEIEIKVSKNDYMVEISVRDTGIGMRKEDMDKLFNAFSRITLENRTIDGTGLGLYLSKKIADLLGGKIFAESEFGKGSEFVLTIPLKFNED